MARVVLVLVAFSLVGVLSTVHWSLRAASSFLDALQDLGGARYQDVVSATEYLDRFRPGDHRNESREDHSRLFLIRPKQPVHLASFTVPGYYSLVTFSASWCVPCTTLREQLIVLLHEVPNLAVIDLDVGTDEGLDGRLVLPLQDFDKVVLPTAFMFSPFGLTLNQSRGAGAPAPVSGYPEILDKARGGLSVRKHRVVVPLDSGRALERLESLEREGGHYAR